MDGDLGAYVRAQIEKTGVISVCRFYDNGFRQITSSTRPIKTPDDLKGFKIRVPPAPMLTSLFKALDAGPAPINFNELYSSLQTKVVEGQENPLADHRHHPALRGAEVLQHDRPRLGRLLPCSATAAPGERLPEDLRTIVTPSSTARPRISGRTSPS